MAKFSKKHYEVIARAIKSTKELTASGKTPILGNYQLGINALGNYLIEVFGADNPRFKADKFKKVAGLE